MDKTIMLYLVGGVVVIIVLNKIIGTLGGAFKDTPEDIKEQQEAKDLYSLPALNGSYAATIYNDWKADIGRVPTIYERWNLQTTSFDAVHNYYDGLVAIIVDAKNTYTPDEPENVVSAVKQLTSQFQVSYLANRFKINTDEYMNVFFKSVLDTETEAELYTFIKNLPLR